MLYYLDTNIVIYAVEGLPAFRQRARNRLASLELAGHRFALSELTWTECLVYPLRSNDGPLLLDYERLFQTPSLRTVPISAAVYRMAAMIRASFHYSLADSLHVAAAVVGGADRFLSNDARLSAFPDLAVEVLP